MNTLNEYSIRFTEMTGFATQPLLLFRRNSEANDSNDSSMADLVVGSIADLYPGNDLNQIAAMWLVYSNSARDLTSERIRHVRYCRLVNSGNQIYAIALLCDTCRTYLVSGDALYLLDETTSLWLTRVGDGDSNQD